MGRRWERFTAEAGKFLTVGGLATVISFVLFNALVHGALGEPAGPLNDQPLQAFAIANFIGMAVSYRGSRSWAFRHREVVGAAGGRISFLLINVGSMVIPLGCLGISRYLFGLDGGVADNVSANVIGLGLGTVARFFLIRKFIFVRPEKARARATAS